MPQIELTVRVLPNGQVQVHGPIHDKILCLGLLELGKNAVLTYQPPKVVVPDMIPPADLTGKPN